MPSIRDFSGGVLNQELLGKDGGAGIMIDAINVLSSWNGELRKRAGTKYLQKLDKKSRIIPYRLPNGNDAILVFDDKRVKGYEYTEAGLTPLVLSSGAKIEFPRIQTWNNNTNGDWYVDSDIQGSGQAFNMFRNDNSFTATVQGANKYISIENLNEPFILRVWSVHFVTGGSTSNFNGFTNPILQYQDDDGVWHTTKSSFEEKRVGYDPGVGPVSSNLYINIFNRSGEDGAHKKWRVLFQTFVGKNSFQVRANAIEVYSSSVSLFDYPTNFSEDDLPKIKYSQAAYDLYIACSGKLPYRIKNESGNITFGEFVPSKTSGVWEANGYPSCVFAFQNRLWFSGFELYPNRAIGSEFNNFENFTTVTSGVKSTDPISADSTELKDIINNLWGGNTALYALSNDGVAVIDSPTGIVATDMINFKLRNREPADGMTPTMKDDIMVYLGRDKRKILITDYDFSVQRYKAKNLAKNYDNFLTSRVVALHYAPRKSSLIYGLTETGQFFCLLFDVDLSKNALFPCALDGVISDLQVFKQGDTTKVLMVVNRNNKWAVIEKMEQPDYKTMDFMTREEKVLYTNDILTQTGYMDFMTTMSFVEPVSEVGVDSIYEDSIVEVIADGIYVGEKQVVGSNLILDAPANKITIGFPYPAYAVIKLATPYTSKKRPKEIATYFINTGYLEVGNSFDNLHPILNNICSTVNMLNKPVLLNGEYVKTIDKMVDNSPYIILKSDKGLPFMITGIDFKVDYSNYQGGI